MGEGKWGFHGARWSQETTWTTMKSRCRRISMSAEHKPSADGGGAGVISAGRSRTAGVQGLASTAERWTIGILSAPEKEERLDRYSRRHATSKAQCSTRWWSPPRPESEDSARTCLSTRSVPASCAWPQCRRRSHRRSYNSSGQHVSSKRHPSCSTVFRSVPRDWNVITRLLIDRVSPNPSEMSSRKSVSSSSRTSWSYRM